MKTTLEIPDAIFRRAKSKAAERGISFREFVTNAVQEKLLAESTATHRPWAELAGKLKHLQSETARINRVIEQEFEQVGPEEWT